MRITYTYTTEVYAIYDDEFRHELRGSLSEIVATCKIHMHTYGFSNVKVIDHETGEILVILEEE